MTQWDFQNKGKSGWTGKSSFALDVPLRYLSPSVIYSVPCDWILQRAYSPFFPPPGAEPGRAKRESRITCMPMLRTPLFFPPNRGKNHIWQYFPEAACGAIFWIIIYKQQFLQSDWVKNISINPKSVEYYQCHAKPHSICFFTTISKITKEIFVRTLLLDGSARS